MQPSPSGRKIWLERKHQFCFKTQTATFIELHRIVVRLFMVLCANMTLYGTLGLLLDKERLPDNSFTYFIISEMNQRDKRGEGGGNIG